MSDISVSATVDVGKNVQQMLEQLAVKIGTTVEHVWPWMVRAQIVSGWTALVLMALTLAAFSVLLAVGIRAVRRDDWEPGPGLALFMVGAVGFSVSLLVSLVSVVPAIQKVTNPEYCALVELVQMVRP